MHSHNDEGSDVQPHREIAKPAEMRKRAHAPGDHADDRDYDKDNDVADLIVGELSK